MKKTYIVKTFVPFHFERELKWLFEIDNTANKCNSNKQRGPSVSYMHFSIIKKKIQFWVAVKNLAYLSKEFQSISAYLLNKLFLV